MSESVSLSVSVSQINGNAKTDCDCDPDTDADADTDPDPVKKRTYFGAHPCPKKDANFLEFRGYVRSSEVSAYWAGTSDFHDAVLDRDRKILQEPIPPSMVIRELALTKGEQSLY